MNPLNKQRGSIMIIVIIMVAVLMASGFVVLNNIQNLNATKSQDSHTADISSVTETIATVLAKSDVCLSGFDGNSGNEAGLQFLDSSGNVSGFNLNSASSASGQNISLPGVYANSQKQGNGNSSTRQRFQANTDIPGTDLRISRLYITNAQAIPSTPGAYKVRVMATFSDSRLAPRRITDLTIILQNGQLSDCKISFSSNNNRELCESLGCNYTDPPTGEKGNCFCPVKAMNCPIGHWVTGVDAEGNMVCSSQALVKECPGVNSYLAGLDSTGQPICATINTTTTTTSTTTTTTTSTTSTTLLAATPGCWKKVSSEVDTSVINPGGFPSSSWSCISDSTPVTVAKNTVYAGGPCSDQKISCDFEFKYGSESWACDACSGPPPKKACWQLPGYNKFPGKTVYTNPHAHCTLYGPCSLATDTSPQGAKCLEYVTTGDPEVNFLGAGYQVYCSEVTDLDDNECVKDPSGEP